MLGSGRGKRRPTRREVPRPIPAVASGCREWPPGQIPRRLGSRRNPSRGARRSSDSSVSAALLGESGVDAERLGMALGPQTRFPARISPAECSEGLPAWADPGPNVPIVGCRGSCSRLYGSSEGRDGEASSARAFLRPGGLRRDRCRTGRGGLVGCRSTRRGGYLVGKVVKTGCEVEIRSRGNSSDLLRDGASNGGQASV